MRKVDSIEKHLLLEAIFLKYGYDFRQYTTNSLDRRFENILLRNKLTSLMPILENILNDKNYFQSLLPQLTINTTEFFRDPLFFKHLKEMVFPLLQTYPSLKFWVAGCSTGEELYSLAILLQEAGLYERSTIYATDINKDCLQQAKEGIFELAGARVYTANYLAAGGIKNPSDYYTANYGMAIFSPALKENIVFSDHNLTTDGVFGEMHLILCRNVMIYFERELQNRVIDLFVRSLTHRGFLGVGGKEDIRFAPSGLYFESLGSGTHLYQKKTIARAERVSS